jgi:Flp pilus assembly pilin Flp
VTGTGSATTCSWKGHAVIELLRAFVIEDRSQDLVEYALLTAFIGFAGLAAFSAMQTAIAQGYVSWDLAEQDLWEPPDPG